MIYLRSSYSADFETTTTPDDCRVWVWGVLGIFDDSVKEWGKDISSFIEWCKTHDGVVYFHNLAFDGSFIIDKLLNDGYEWVKENPKEFQFTTLISNTGKFYSIKVNFAESIVEFKDSMKKLPFSVASIAGAFNLEMDKLELDYDKPRPVGYEPDKSELLYLYHDIAIVAQAMKVVLSEGMTRLTVGADSLADYKSVIGSRKFKRLFPILSPELDSEIRKAYRGGFTYADPRFSRRLLGCGKVYDVNSLYPYVMRECEIPTGMPRFIDGEPPSDGSLFIVSITFTAKLRDGFIPCIQVKKSPYFSPTQYQTEIGEPVTISVTSIDLALWEKHYDLNVISYNGCFVFDSVTGVFNEYIDKWMEVKENSTGAMRTLAKLHLNSLYGKFATNTDVTGKYPVLEDCVVKLKLGDKETRDPVYTPAGVFITAHARSLTVTAAQNNYDRFAYADTDSIHLVGSNDPVGITVHETRLGAWKHEGDFSQAVFVRAKQYGETIEGVDHIHIAGLPYSVTRNINVKNLLSDNVYYGKLIPKRVPGGVVLVETEFSFKA